MQGGTESGGLGSAVAAVCVCARGSQRRGDELVGQGAWEGRGSAHAGSKAVFLCVIALTRAGACPCRAHARASVASGLRTAVVVGGHWTWRVSSASPRGCASSAAFQACLTWRKGERCTLTVLRTHRYLVRAGFRRSWRRSAWTRRATVQLGPRATTSSNGFQPSWVPPTRLTRAASFFWTSPSRRIIPSSHLKSPSAPRSTTATLTAGAQYASTS